MEFSLDKFKDKDNNYYPKVFNMKHGIDHAHYQEMKERWDGSMDEESVYKKLKKRTTTQYFIDIKAAQADVLAYSKSVFPAYEFIMPDVLMDDWLSIMDPHKDGKRDHSLHQPLTAYIVSELLGNGNPEKGLMVNGSSLLSLCADILATHDNTEYLRRYFKNIYNGELPPDEYSQTWAESVFYHATMIAALFHDIGYPWQYINKVRRGIGNAEIIGDDSIDLSAKSIFSHISSRLLIYPFCGYSQKMVQLPISMWKDKVLRLIYEAYNDTHGFPGALAFMFLNDKLRAYPEIMTLKYAETCFIQDWAAVGIMMHDMMRLYYGMNGKKLCEIPQHPNFRLSIDTDPLSCLIAMADLLEEFGRPRSEFTPHDDKVDITFIHHCDKTEVDVVNDVIQFKYTLNDYGKQEDKASDIRDEVKAYFRPDVGFIDLSGIGINNYELL
jgi:hypothetical protein